MHKYHNFHSKQLFIIVDGSSYLYRAYYAFPSLTDSKNKPTGAVYGVLSMLRTLIFKYQPAYTVVVFDNKSKTFRNSLFKQYKSNRPSMPIDLQLQIEPLYAMINTIGLPLITIPGVEADDVIGTLARQAEKVGCSVLISSNDKDMAQLVTSKVLLLHTKNSTILGVQEVKQKYGIQPNLVVDFLALMGDNSDNIPGVPGIGKKIAKILLNSLGCLDKLYNTLEKVTCLNLRGAKTIATKLKNNKDIAYLSYQLAKIKTDVPLEFSREKLFIQQNSYEHLLRLFKTYESITRKNTDI